MKNSILTFIIGLILGAVIMTAIFFVYEKLNTNENNMPNGERPHMMENGEMPPDMFDRQGEKSVKETLASDIDEGTRVSQSKIDLSQYDTNITITKSGEYTLTGEFKKSVLVNAEGNVTLILNGVNIESENTAAISNISSNNLTIKLAQNTINNLSDGGASEYDACIYSNGKLIIEGDGTLNVYGNQEEGEGIATETNDITINGGTINIECQDDGINAGGDGGLITINGGDIFINAKGDGIDSNKNLIINGGNIYTIGSPTGGDAGIDTDDGFEINGGNVIALGSDMLEKPETTSKQKSICVSLTNKVDKGNKISVISENEEEIISFEAKEQFKTLIISNNKVSSGTYYLYINGEKTNYTLEVK